jgi:hypothetical protein
MELDNLCAVKDIFREPIGEYIECVGRNLAWFHNCASNFILPNKATQTFIISARQLTLTNWNHSTPDLHHSQDSDHMIP